MYHLLANNFPAPVASAISGFLLYLVQANNMAIKAIATDIPINIYSVEWLRVCALSDLAIMGERKCSNQWLSAANTSGIPINPPTTLKTAKTIKGMVIAEGLSCR